MGRKKPRKQVAGNSKLKLKKRPKRRSAAPLAAAQSTAFNEAMSALHGWWRP